MWPRGWAALFATAGWAVLLAPALTTYAGVGPAGVFALAALIGVPLVACAAVLTSGLRIGLAAPSATGPSPDRPAGRPGREFGGVTAGIVAALVLGGLAIAIEPSASDVAIRAAVGERILALVPGPSTAWAILLAVALTVVALGVGAPTGGRPRLKAVVVASAVLVAGGVFVWAGDAAASGNPRPGACRDDVPASPAAHAVATGDVDGRSVGDVVATRHGSAANVTTVTYVTVWGAGSATLRDVGSAAYATGALDAAARANADDVGLDRVGATPARHCRMVIDGRTAIAAFPALRWLAGGRPDAPDAGVELVAWRGTLDYWIVRTNGTAGEGPARLRLATVEVSGLAPAWPAGPGLRASLRAASSFDVP